VRDAGLRTRTRPQQGDCIRLGTHGGSDSDEPEEKYVCEKETVPAGYILICFHYFLKA